MPVDTHVSAITLDRISPDPAEQARLVVEAPDGTILDTRQASAFLGVAPETLEVWRSTRRQQIPYLKIGRCVRYRLGDLRKFQDSCRVEANNV